MFPPGRDKLVTSLTATGSTIGRKTTGNVAVAFCTARAEGIEIATKTSGFKPTSSLANWPMFFLQQAHISELAEKQRIPIMCPAEVFAGSGFLMSYGASWPAIFRRAPVYVDKILKGAIPADLPVEQPTKFDLVVNLKTAKMLGIEIPAVILSQADRIID